MAAAGRNVVVKMAVETEVAVMMVVMMVMAKLMVEVVLEVDMVVDMFVRGTGRSLALLGSCQQAGISSPASPSVETLKKPVACLLNLLPSGLRGLAMKIFCVLRKVGSTGRLESVAPRAVMLDSAGGLVPKP